MTEIVSKILVPEEKVQKLFEGKKKQFQKNISWIRNARNDGST